MNRNTSRKGVGGWNKDGTENWKRHDWLYKYIPQYIDGKPMHAVHKREYNDKWNKKHKWNKTITFNKELDADVIETIDYHIPHFTDFVRHCVRAYAEYYHLFDDEENEVDIE